MLLLKKEDYIPEKIWTADNLLWLIDNQLIGKKDVINTLLWFFKRKRKNSPSTLVIWKITIEFIIRKMSLKI